MNQIINALTPEQLKDPITTALWESRLSAIAAGTEQFDTFMADQAHLLPILITPITESAGTDLQGHSCPECGKALRRLPSRREGKAWNKTTKAKTTSSPLPRRRLRQNDAPF